MAKSSVKSTQTGPDKYKAYTDVRCVGSGRSGLKALFAPKTPSFCSVDHGVNIKEKDYVVL